MAPGQESAGRDRSDLARRIEELDWYHTMELDGVITPGWFDTRPTVEKVPLPANLSGRRCLDVGTWDGFWAFEMERRDAASVTAIDIEDPGRWDWPARHGAGPEVVERTKAGAAAFTLAREALGSSVERVDLSVYELEPERLGSFDLVFVGSLLLHLRDPVGALERVRSVCSGELVVADAVDAFPSLTHPRSPTARLEGIARPWWWTPNVAGLRRMVEAGGFEIVERRGIYFLPLGPGHRGASLRKSPFSAEGREQILVALKGLPHSAVRARPQRVKLTS